MAILLWSAGRNLLALEDNVKNKIIRLMCEEYRSHLFGVLKEVNVFDSRDKLVISPDLKVVHEPSGYEYTVDSVKGKNGNAQITLRMPDVPRPTAKSVDAINTINKDDKFVSNFPQIEVESDDVDDGDSKVDVGKKAYTDQITPPEEAEDTIFVVDQKEFEKHYREA